MILDAKNDDYDVDGNGDDNEGVWIPWGSAQQSLLVRSQWEFLLMCWRREGAGTAKDEYEEDGL